MTAKKYGYNSYCSLYGEHKGDPCACGWSSKNDYSEFGQDLVHYVALFKREKNVTYDPSLGELLAWVLVKVWD
jgi:hypothetical protein